MFYEELGLPFPFEDIQRIESRLLRKLKKEALPVLYNAPVSLLDMLPLAFDRPYYMARLVLCARGKYFFQT